MQLSILVTGTLLNNLIIAGPHNDQVHDPQGGRETGDSKAIEEEEAKNQSKAIKKNKSTEDHELEQIAVHQCMNICQNTTLDSDFPSTSTAGPSLFLTNILIYFDHPQCSIDHENEMVIRDLEPILDCQSTAEQFTRIVEETTIQCCERCVEQQNHSSRLDISCGHHYSSLIRCMAKPENRWFADLAASDPFIFLDEESDELPCYAERNPYILGICGKE